MKQIELLAFLIATCPMAMGQSPYASLQVPKQIQYQGRVATATGGEWSGSEGYFSFALIQGATVLWNNWEGTASPSDPGAVSLGAGQVLTQPIHGGVFTTKLGEGTDTNEPIPATVFFDTTSNAVRNGVKLAVWFSPDGSTFIRLSPDVEFTAVPYAMVSSIAEAVKERAVTTEMIKDETLVASDMSPELKADSLIPAGSVMPFAGTLAPPGWAFCDGSSHAINETGYARLYSIILFTHGGSGANFNLPDYRGRFLRGVDGNTGRDPDATTSANLGVDGKRYPMNPGGNPGNSVGSIQGAQFAQHLHSITDPGHTHNVRTRASYENPPNDTGSGSAQFLEDYANFNSTNSVNRPNAMKADTNITGTNDAGGRETRPVNAYVNYIIKL